MSRVLARSVLLCTHSSAFSMSQLSLLLRDIEFNSQLLVPTSDRPDFGDVSVLFVRTISWKTFLLSNADEFLQIRINVSSELLFFSVNFLSY